MDTLSSRTPKGKPHYTYTLAYPEDYPDPPKAGTVFYVGKGTEKKWGRGRILNHENEARNGKKSYKCNVIRKIWANGGQVIKKILAYFPSHEMACQYEVALIFFLPNLTNETEGGEGTRGLSEDARRKISETSKGRKMPPRSEYTRHLISENLKQRLADPEYRRKQGETLRASPKAIEQRRKKAEAERGKPKPEETQARLRKYGEERKGKPRVFTEEHKRNLNLYHTSLEAIEQRRQLAEFNREREYTEEHRQNISKAQKGKSHPLSEKGLQRLVEYNKSRRGKPHPLSEEGLRRIAESNRIKKTGKKQSPEHIAKRVASIKKRNAEKRNAVQLEFPEMPETSLE